MRVIIDGVEYAPRQLAAPGSSLAGIMGEARRSLGLTLGAAARGAGISKTYLWEIEAGKAADPSFRVVCRLAESYGLDVADIARNAGGPAA